MREFYQYSIPVLWIAWLIYWTAAAFGAKPTRREESPVSRLSHIVPLAVGVGLLATRHVPFDWLMVRFLPRTAVWFWIGFALVVLGLVFTIAARVWLGSNWSGTVTLKQDHELIRAGPYRWVRHPIYTGLLLAFIGSAIALGELRGVVALALVTLAFLRKIVVEEQFLTEQFGAAYTHYRDKVPSLVPIPRRGHS